jgi:hypothetical protein
MNGIRPPPGHHRLSGKAVAGNGVAKAKEKSEESYESAIVELTPDGDVPTGQTVIG